MRPCGPFSSAHPGVQSAQRCPVSIQGQSLSRGISVIEILVGLAIGLVLVTGMSSMVVGSRQTSRSERQLLEMQATGRIAIDVVGRELRKAGFRANRERSLADVFAPAAAPFGTASAVVAATATEDGFTVRFQGSGDSWTSDCLGNAIGAGHDIWETIWLQGGALRCQVRNQTTNTEQTLALIPQVEAMTITYGIDDDGDGFADAYRNATAVANWSRVASVNVQLRIVSSEDGLADVAQPYRGFDGVAVIPSDRRLRRNYSTVVALRNILP